MKKVLLVFGLILLILFSGCTQKEAPAGYSIYTNSTYGVEINYPSDWEKTEGFMGTVVMFKSPLENDSDLFLENINIMVTELSPPILSIADYKESIQSYLEQYITDYELIEMVDATLANTPAIKVVYTGRLGQSNLMQLQMVTVKNNKSYVISYTAEPDKYEKYLDKAEKVMASFKITG